MVKVNQIPFSDMYITPDKTAYIPDNITESGLGVLKAEDFDDFFKVVEKAYDGENPSYSVKYDKHLYRVERSVSIDGIQYCARKIPQKVPPFSLLGFSDRLTQYLLSLSNRTGLILWSGPTGAGKTTSISSLMREFLVAEGGFAYTIEDPSEMPLDGVYKSLAGGLGLCKQTQPINGSWGNSLKSALRSKPRYIFVGEIRTPDTASEVLRAATSGHLVFSTIHANNVTDAINSLVKYAASTTMSEELAYDLFARGILAIVHQNLAGIGQNKTPYVSHLFANPDSSRGCQVRGIIKTGKLNLGTSIETQMTRLAKGMNMFPEA